MKNRLYSSFSAGPREPRDGQLEAMLDGSPPPDDRPELAPVGALLAAMTAEPESSELVGSRTAEAAFRDIVGGSSSTRRPRRPAMISTLVGAKLGATIAGVAVGLGGAAIAVSAHTAAPQLDIAPAATATPAVSSTKPPAAGPTSTPVGPDAKGPAAFALCTAWSHIKDHGTKAEQSVAFRNLAAAAGGEAKIATYCATVGHPGNGSAGKPDVHGPAQHRHPTGKPSGHPNGKPDSLATPGTGKESPAPAPAGS